MAKISRNDPCPCGSGKKYKKCCLANQSQQRQTTPRGKFRFEPGSYGQPESCVPSIACLRDGGDSSEYHLVLVKPDTVLDSPDLANAIATEDLNAAFSTKTSAGYDEALAMFLRERGYVRVDDFNVVDTKPGSAASWMGADGLHCMSPGHAPTLEQLDAASELYQENIRKSPLWDEMVKEFGEEKAEQLLSQFRVEKR